MRFVLATIFLASTVVWKGSSLAPSTTLFGRPRTTWDFYPVDKASIQKPSSQSSSSLYSTMEEQQVLVEPQSSVITGVEIVSVPEEEEQASSVEMTVPAINTRLEKQLESMRIKDQLSKQLTKEVGETR
jgi:hypothetical protein